MLPEGLPQPTYPYRTKGVLIGSLALLLLAPTALLGTSSNVAGELCLAAVAIHYYFTTEEPRPSRWLALPCIVRLALFASVTLLGVVAGLASKRVLGENALGIGMLVGSVHLVVGMLAYNLLLPRIRRAS